MKKGFRLVITCPDRTGIVSAVSTAISSHGGAINEANQYTDDVNSYFFMRYEIGDGGKNFDVAGFEKSFMHIADEYEMRWELHNISELKRVVLMVSKLSHCLTDLLYRWKCGDMQYEVPCVISNHEDLRDYVEWHGIPYYCVPVSREPAEKQRAFERVVEIIDNHSPDTIVLARYMQIMPPWICKRYENQIINIHHSFLPSFVGAKPYHQAQERGVKLTGATCHYVTEELDAGPIIEQDVIRISHHDAIDEIVRLGKDVEKSVLARGLRYHLENRVLVQGNKTIVFN